MTDTDVHHLFELEAPNPDCLATIYTTGRTGRLFNTGTIAAHPNLSGRPDVFPPAVIDELLTGRATPADQAAFAAAVATDPAVLDRVMRRERRATVLCAAVNNPHTTTASLIALAEHRADIEDEPWSTMTAAVFNELIRRYDVMPTAEAVGALCDHLPLNAYHLVGRRTDLTVADIQARLGTTYRVRACFEHPRDELTFAEAIAANPAAVRWPAYLLVWILASAGDDTVRVATALHRTRPEMITVHGLDDILLTIACSDYTEPGPFSIGYGTQRDDPTTLAVDLAGNPATSRDHLARLHARHPNLASRIATNRHADPAWWVHEPLHTPAGMTAAGRLLAGDPRFASPAMWAAAHALVDSWHGTVGDFVDAATQLLTIRD